MLQRFNASQTDYLLLADWRRTVAELYAQVRQVAAFDPCKAWQDWRAGRDRLFRDQPHTPLSAEQLVHFAGLDYYPYDPALRVMGEITEIQETTRSVSLPEGPLSLTPFARVTFPLAGDSHTLTLFWIGGYGGGLFLPFQDATSGTTTYGGGRYLYDTIKGANLGGVAPDQDKGRFLLDFNFAYNPSCAYNDRWLCPLAPPENRLALQIAAGEQVFSH